MAEAGKPRFTSSPGSLVLPATGVTMLSAPQFVTVTNTSNSRGTATATLSGANPGDFVATPEAGCSNVPARGTCKIAVRIRPTADGARSATLTVKGGSGQPPSVALSGSGIAGRWSSVYPWPDVAIHLGVLPTGTVFSFSDDNHEDFETSGTRQADFTKSFFVDIPPDGAPGAVQYVPNSTTNMFCSAHTFLPDGRLIVMGGHEGRDSVGSTDTNILEYGTQYTWRLQASDPMNGGRWYPTAVTLANGDIVVAGGDRTGPGDVNPIPEVWNSAIGGWRELSNAWLQMPLYSPMHLAPNGNVFMSGTHQFTRYLDTSGTGSWISLGNRLYGLRDYGSSVLYDDGKVLVMGGGDPPTATAEIIDLNAVTPTWQWTSSMAYARRQHNATLLADGKVLVTGGTSSGGFNDGTNAVFAAELWDPATGKWITLSAMQIKRLYHSSAVLLPDGRVLSAGGGRPAAIAAQDNEDAEIFSPPYLFNGPRPTITGAPATVSYGQSLRGADAGCGHRKPGDLGATIRRLARLQHESAHQSPQLCCRDRRAQRHCTF
jgi:hypothetical protein